MNNIKQRGNELIYVSSIMVDDGKCKEMLRT